MPSWVNASSGPAARESQPGSTIRGGSSWTARMACRRWIPARSVSFEPFDRLTWLPRLDDEAVAGIVEANGRHLGDVAAEEVRLAGVLGAVDRDDHLGVGDLLRATREFGVALPA